MKRLPDTERQDRSRRKLCVHSFCLGLFVSSGRIISHWCRRARSVTSFALGFERKKLRESIVETLSVAGDFDSEPLDADGEYGVVLAIFAAAVLANEDAEIVIVNDLLVFLAETSPFGFGRLRFQILFVDYVDF